MSGGGRITSVDDGEVRTWVIEHPQKRNALTTGMLEQLVQHARAIGDDSTVGPRAVVLRGASAGRAFSSGFDLTAIDDEQRAAGLDPIQAAADAIGDCPVPVVAALDGAAFGGAVEIALACHVRVGAPTLKLGMPPARLGVTYSTTGLRRFLRRLPESQVVRLFATGMTIDGVEAERIGLVDELAEDPAHRAHELALAVAQNAPLAVRGTLRSLRVLTEADEPELGRDVAEELLAIRMSCLDSRDVQEGLAAIRGKRSPSFEGR